MIGRLRLTGFGLTICCLLACVLLRQPARAEADGERVNRALLIGVDDFVSRVSTYPSSTNNVFAMQEVLQASSMPFETIMIPDVPTAGTQALGDLIRETFAGADEDDVSYLYLCTHGEYNPDTGEVALLLSDGVTEDRLTPPALEAALQRVAGTKVILLDACYSGAFIGKGMHVQPADVCFLGDAYKVLASSGAMEKSWYWNTDGSTELNAEAGDQQGAFYFTQALSQCLSPRYGFPADVNRDGNVTLRELYQTLLENHAASTPQVYPQEDNFVVFSYDLSALNIDAEDKSPIGNVTFSSSTLSAADPQLTVEFIAMRPVRVAYQIVNQRDGQWRFDEARLMYDDTEQYTAFGDERGAITAGRKVRKLKLTLASGETGGYILVQLVSIEAGKLTVHAGRVIAIPPETGELMLGVETAQNHCADDPRELAIFVKHAYPCQLSVAILNEQGDVVRRLCHRQSTRPLGISPNGSTFYWDGRDKAGNTVIPGQYRISITGYMGESQFSTESGLITVTPSEG